MDVFEQTIFVIGGAWTCLVGFLVLGMYRQNYHAQHNSRGNRRGGQFLTAKNLNPIDAVASSYPITATRAPAGASHSPKKKGIKMA